MQNKSKKITITLLFFFTILLGMNIERFLTKDEFDDESSKLLDVLNITEKYYLDTLDRKQLVENAIEGIFKDLDPHTSYIPPLDQEVLFDDIRGDFEGIGVEFNIVDDTINVVTVLSGGPSETVGLESGDRIIAINDSACIGFTNRDVIKNLRGPKGSEVKLTVYRNVTYPSLDFTVVRDLIPSNSVDVAIKVNETDAFIVLSKFSETSTKELIENLERLTSEGMQRLILDLRNNPGGLLDQAQSVSDLFISDDKLIVYTEGRDGMYKEQLFAKDKFPYEDIPLVVLVSRGSASASEIVSGAVQDWDRGLIVGETTFGKGLVQRPFMLEDNSAIRVTIAKYFTPSGRVIQRDYKKKDDYYTNLISRNEDEGNNFNHNAEVDSLLPTYKTSGGRVVYGGGGITPDYIVNSDTLTEVTRALRRGNIFTKFVRVVRPKYVNIISEKYGENINKFAKEFNFSNNDFEDLTNFVKKNSIDLKRKEIFDACTDISLILKAYLARSIWHEEGWYRVMLEEDRQFDKALELLDDANKMLN